MTTTADLIPLRALNQVGYCERLYYLEHVDAVMPTNEHVEDGLFEHRRVNDPELENITRKDGDTLKTRSVSLSSEKWGLTGKLDLIEEKGGRIYPVEAGPRQASMGQTWWLTSEAERKAGWRPGGIQQLAADPQKSRLYAVMHRGGLETHKDPGKDVWVYDLSTRQRVQQFTLKNLASSIQVSTDAQPLLYSIFIESTDLDIYDAASGKLLRSVDHIGTSPTIMVTP